MAARAASRRFCLSAAVFDGKCILGQSIRPIAQFCTREAEAGTRIYGAPKRQRLHLPCQFDWPRYIPPGYDRSVSSVFERKCSKPLGFENLQQLSPKPKPKSDIIVRHIDEDRCEYFTAYSREKDGTLSRKYDIYPPTPVQEGSFFSRSSCNGLVYFQNEAKEHLLWNPTTNELKTLPKPFDELPRLTYHDVAFEMWFDHGSSEDYKVLLVVLADEEDEEGECIDLSNQIALYSLKTKSWKKIPGTEFGFCELGGVCVNGFYYSIAFQKGSRVILSFEFSTATLSSLPLPNLSKSDLRDVIVYNGMLGVLVFSWKEIEVNYALWVMNDGSWSKETVFHTHGVRKLEWFSENGELLYFQNLNDELLVFDRATGKSKPLGVYGVRGSIELIPFFESLVQLNRVSEVEKQEKEEEGHMIEAKEGPLVQA